MSSLSEGPKFADAHILQRGDIGLIEKLHFFLHFKNFIRIVDRYEFMTIKEGSTNTASFSIIVDVVEGVET